MATRINKYLSEIGHCSRRGADKLLEQGRITINGAVPELGEKVQEGDVVAVDGKVVGERTEKHVYIAVNKPRGIVCTTDRRRKRQYRRLCRTSAAHLPYRKIGQAFRRAHSYDQ